VPARKILLVEDEGFLRRIFKGRLVKEGYEVTDVESAERALERLPELRPDLIILDLYLPKMSGFDLLKLLKADPALRDIPVVILSGLGQESDIRKGLELGALEYVVKANVSPRELLAKISKLLARKAGDQPQEG
jgi:DNA-binding response OmpR family regulator